MEENEDILMKFVRGECSDLEAGEILRKAKESQAFREKLARLKQIYVNQSMPDKEASNSDYSKFKKYAELREKEERHTSKIKFSTIIWWSTAAVIIALLALNLEFNWMSSKGIKSNDVIPIAENSSIHTLYTAKGVKGSVVLPDGSKVALNSDSKIIYPAEFKGKSRNVSFSGEGYFEVKKDSAHPMVISCNKDFMIEVYGTTFNIKSYDNDEESSATLYQGNIRVVERRNGKEYVTDVTPSQTVIISEVAPKPAIVETNDIEKVSEWKDGKLSFDSMPMHEAAKILERWHGVNIIISNKDLIDVPITATFTTESMVQILDLLKFSIGIKYEINGKTVTIY